MPYFAAYVPDAPGPPLTAPPRGVLVTMPLRVWPFSGPAGAARSPAGQAAVPAVISFTAAPTTCKHRLAEVQQR